MRAGKWEFEQRFFLFGMIFGVGFLLYAVDHTNCVQWLASRISSDSHVRDNLERTAVLLGTVVLFLTALFRTWATSYLKTEVVHDQRQHADSVVADGPYRYTRNPLYFGNIFLAIGIGLLASRLGFVFLVVAMWIYCYRLIGREEEMLLSTQGESYQRYFRAVPRFWPSLRPRLPASGARPRWAQAFAGESMFWFAAIAMLVFAITFNLLAYSIVFGVGMVVYIASVSLIQKRRQAKI